MKRNTLFILILLITTNSYAQNWILKWADEFNASSLDVSNTWSPEVNGDGGGNSELQYYRSENLSLENYQGFNCMVLNAKRESYLGKSFTSARLNTLGKVYFQYGKIESRMKIPSTANGLWPAFWFMGNDYSGSNWPYCGEIDVMECGHSAGIASGTQSSFMGGAMHWGPISPVFIHYMDYTAAAGPYSIQDGFHLFTLVWSADSINMYLDLDKFPKAAPYYKKRIAADATQNIYNYFHKPFHILYNLAVGGASFTGISTSDAVTAVPTDGTPAKLYIDYIRVYQKGDLGEQFHSNTTYPADTNPPTGITASIGAVTQTSVEFLLNGTDNSGSVIYTVSYNGTTSSTEAISGTQKSFIVTGLMPGTSYNFTVTAKDASLNTATTGSIPLIANTLPSSDCAGISNVASQGTFDSGYSYSFTTSGTSVAINFEMLDNKAGIVAYLWDYTSGFAETQMTNVSGKKFSISLSGKTSGSIIKVACKFAYAGGMTVTKQLSYTVGNNCGTAALETITSSDIWIYPNPAANWIHISATSEIQEIQLKNILGQTVKILKVNGLQQSVDISDIPTGNYLVISKLENGRLNINKIVKR